jgi:hypothetical protein
MDVKLGLLGEKKNRVLDRVLIIYRPEEVTDTE